MRTEKDYLGTLQIPDDALFGIHSFRAKLNFPGNSKFSVDWYMAMGIVKKACYITYADFKSAAKENYNLQKLGIRFLDDEIIYALIDAADDVSEGKYFDNFIVPAIQGGAGTSINMNINEIITNLALKKLNHKPGDYHFIDPLEAANIYQSTNDTVPTALKIAVMRKLNILEEKINELRFCIENLEIKYRNVLRMAYTQLQEAVPSSYGKLFSSYSQALGRDWWRISKCFERIKTVNLGGSAVGTSISVPRFFVMNVVQNLKHLTDLPVTKSDNLVDNTANLDAFAEIHGILKANAVNLEKISSDVRLLASDLIAKNEVLLPQKQVGSSIMPSKINPVIPEFVIASAHIVYANDVLINQLCGQGQLDLNANLPTIGNAILHSLELLINATESLNKNLFAEIVVNAKTAEQNFFKSPAITTALIPFVGYNKAAELAKYMRQYQINIFDANEKLKILNPKKIAEILNPGNLLKNGFSLNDLIN